MNVWIIIINITIYLFILIAAIRNGFETDLIKYFALQPSNILQGKYLSSLVLHMFTHTYIWHLFINMFVLFSLGSLTEKIVGRKRFVWFYLISGLFAGILSVMLSGVFGTSRLGAIIFGSPDIPAVGASGAIFGVAALLMVLLPRLKFVIIFLPFFAFPAYILIPIVLFAVWAITIIVSVVYKTDILIGNVAHFGGFLIGLIYGFYLRFKYKRKIQKLQHYFK